MGHADTTGLGRAGQRPGQSSRKGFPTPLAGILVHRCAALGLVLITALQCVLALSGAPAWPCMVLTLTGIPCLSCGMSRACIALLQGRFDDALHLHVFAFGVPVIVLLLFAGGVLPQESRRRLIDIVTRVERRTGVTLLIACGFVGYYALRMSFFRAAFVSWVYG